MTLNFIQTMLASRLLHLPPTLRGSIAARHNINFSQISQARRNFSASAPRQFSPTDAVVSLPIAALDAVHYIGFPWYAAIPLTAVLVRCTVGYFFGDLPARKKQIIRRHIAPLISYNAIRLSRGSMRELEKDLKEWDLRKYFRFTVLLDQLRLTHKLGAIFNAPLFSVSHFVNILTLAAFAEAIRVKCGGAKEGLINLFMFPFEKLEELRQDVESRTPGFGNRPVQDIQPQEEAGSASTEDLNPPQEIFVKSPEELLADRLEAAHEIVAQKRAEALESGVPLDPMLLDPTYYLKDVQPIVSESRAENLDLSMATEGLAWFQDLTVADTWYILPVILGSTILWTAFVGQEIRKSPPRVLEARKVSRPNISQGAMSSKSRKIGGVDIYESQTTKDVNAALQSAEQMKAAAIEEKKKAGVLFPNLTFQQSTRIVAALGFSLMSTYLPAGIVLYFIGSNVAGILIHSWMSYRYPLPPMVSPCAIPLRLKVRKAYASMLTRPNITSR
jgi:hypothetical protein